MESQSSLQLLLAEEYQRIRSKRSSFSQRAFAQKLGLSSGALSGIMNGKRRVSTRYAFNLLEKLEIDPLRVQSIMTDGIVWKKDSPLNKKIRELSADDFFIVSQGIHFALLSLMETSNFKSDLHWMSQRLGKSKTKIKSALERLERLGLIAYKKKRYSVSSEVIHSTDEIPNSAIRQSHHESLEEAIVSLEKDLVSERDFTSQTMAIDPKNLPLAKKMIRQLRIDLENLMEKGEKKEVYKLAIQLFPLTTLSRDENDDSNVH